MSDVTKSLTSPRLLAPQIGGNAFQFQFAAQPSAIYSIQLATNPAAPAYWQTLWTIYNSTGGVYQISDPAATNDAARFYRVLAQ